MILASAGGVPSGMAAKPTVVLPMVYVLPTLSAIGDWSPLMTAVIDSSSLSILAIMRGDGGGGGAGKHFSVD